MKEEEKRLLRIDICHRLPYGLKATDGYTVYDVLLHLNKVPSVSIEGLLDSDNEIKPILFPLASLTEETELHGEKFIPLQRLSDFERGRIEVKCGKVLSRIKEGKFFSIASFGTPTDAINYKTTGCFFAEIQDGPYTAYHQYQMFDEMDRFMIDYRGLIDKGLAVSALVLDNNPYK